VSKSALHTSGFVRVSRRRLPQVWRSAGGSGRAVDVAAGPARGRLHPRLRPTQHRAAWHSGALLGVSSSRPRVRQERLRICPSSTPVVFGSVTHPSKNSVRLSVAFGHPAVDREAPAI